MLRIIKSTISREDIKKKNFEEVKRVQISKMKNDSAGKKKIYKKVHEYFQWIIHESHKEKA
jgi:hypothetical protein